MSTELTIELPEKTKTSKVMYADTPVKLGGIPREITLDELSKKVRRPFIYSDALFSKGKHPPYSKNDSKPKSFPSNYILKKFEQLGFADISAFVICNMGQVGHGVVANRDFEPGECFILYSGIIRDNSHSEKATDYAFAYGKEVSLFVDAVEIGNISSFIQHMPLNFNLVSKQTQKNLDSSNSQLQDKESTDYWQWRNIVYKSGLTEVDVAWANLQMMIVFQQGVPCIILYNPDKINKGDQLGISYGYGYWIRRKLKPELFDLKGSFIPATQYGYEEVAIDLPLIEVFNKFPHFQKIGVQKSCNAAMFRKDLCRQQEVMQPVWFSHLAEPVSIFKLRELLLQYNVIGNEYKPIENEFILKLRNMLPKEFSIKMFERDPSQRFPRTLYDVVCTTDDLMKWSQLTVLLKGPLFAQTAIQNKCLKFTQEVIIMDIGHNMLDQMLLLTFFMRDKIQDFFKKDLSEDDIPSGPTRKDPTAIIIAKAEEAISQILFHNPGLKRKDIDDVYTFVDNFCNAKANTSTKIGSPISSDKETRLTTITSSFFKNKIPTNWKIYPLERLKGKYLGHQVRFFNIPTDYNTQAEPFFNLLKQNGFEGELTKKNDKPSIVVDLTASALTFK